MSRLEKRLHDWVSNNIISREQAEGIRQYEANAPGSSWVLYSFLILGATIISIGFISLIAANWDDIPDAVKLGLDFLLLIGLAIGIHHTWEKKNLFSSKCCWFVFCFFAWHPSA